MTAFLTLCGLVFFDKKLERRNLVPALTRSRAIFRLQAFPAVDRGEPIDQGLIEALKSDPVHQALEVTSSLRPPVDIAVTANLYGVRKELRE